LQFGLRTLFVAVTIVAIFVGYHVNWIRQRRIALEALGISINAKDRKAPGLLWLFGEPGHDLLFINDNDPEHKRRVERLFPEAEVLQQHEWITPRPSD
jgi:hypothetical protein